MAAGGLSCGGACMKYTLLFFNFFFWIIGALLLGVGIWILVDPNIDKYLQVITVDKENPYIMAAIYTLIAVGAFIFLTGFLGCCGACQESPCMLGTYAVLLSIVFIGMIAGGILAIVFNQQLGEELRVSMEKQAKTSVSTNNKDAVTAAWNLMQYNLKCCGSNNYMDYRGSKYETESSILEPVPYTCCKLQNKDPDNPIPEAGCQTEAQVDNLKISQYLYLEGCHQNLSDWLKSKATIITGIAIGFAFVMLFGIIFACCVRSEISKRQEY